VITAHTTPKTLPMAPDFKPSIVPPEWKKQPHPIKAAHKSKNADSGPSTSHVAIPARTPTLSDKAIELGIIISFFSY
jgi:hypothetical protein